MTGKIAYLDGLRGIAAVNVMIMHFFVILAPAMVYGGDLPLHLGSFEHLFPTTPLGLIGAGNFSVCIFFVLSGYVLTQKYFRTKDRNIIISGTVRRYIRLFVPVFAAVMLSFVLAFTGLYSYYFEAINISAGSNYRDYWTFTPDIIDAVKQAAWGSFFTSDDTYYNPVLWTMKVEFLGSMLVFAMALFFGQLRNRLTFYLAAIVLFLHSYYLAFVIGMVLADTFNSQTRILKTGNKTVLSVLLITGLFLGSYPINPVTGDSLYWFLNNGFFRTPKISYHIIGASLVMYVLLNSQLLQKFFSLPVPVFLGKISYSMYLVHFPIISSFTCALFLALYPALPYGTALLISCAASTLLIIPLSYLFYRYIDSAGVELSKKFYNWLTDFRKPAASGNIKQEQASSTIFTIYDKIFK